MWNREQKFPESYKVAKTFRWTDTHTRAVNVYYDDIMMRLSGCSLIVLIKFLCKTISSPLTFSILSRRESNSTCCRYYIEVGGFFQTRCRTLVFTALCFKFYYLTGVIMFQSKVKVTRSQVFYMLFNMRVMHSTSHIAWTLISSSIKHQLLH